MAKSDDVQAPLETQDLMYDLGRIGRPEYVDANACIVSDAHFL